MVVRAIDAPRMARQPAGTALNLSEGEKAMLFDLALEAGGFRAGREAWLEAAPLIAAFARAYVTIRDREDGLI